MISSISGQVLTSGQLGTSEATVYTCPASCDVRLTNACVVNSSGAPASVSISLVRAGGTGGAANRVYINATLAAGSTVQLPSLAGHFLGAGDFVSAIAGTASAVSLVVSGEVRGLLA